jgi:hypothetical protein
VEYDMKLRAIGTVSLRAGDEWLRWKDGEVFEPPDHMDVKRALARGIVVEAGTRKVKEAETDV